MPLITRQENGGPLTIEQMDENFLYLESISGGTGSGSGTSGTSGINGVTGPSGLSGSSGTSGATGPSGTSGINGSSGSGTSGTSGINGATGPSGGQGSTWQSYTPTFTGGYNVTGITIDRAIYKKEDRYVTVTVSLMATTNSSIGNKNLHITLPHSIYTSLTNLGFGSYFASEQSTITSEKGAVFVQRESSSEVGFSWTNKIITDIPDSIIVTFIYETNE